MGEKTKRRLIRIFILSAIAFAVGAGMGLFEVSNTPKTEDKKPAFVKGVDIGGPFSLLTHEDVRVSEQDFMGQYKLIYFGFTYCPAICPTELQKITKVMDILGEQSEDIQPIFITVDPERDDVEAMRAYVELFHDRLIGLTGNAEEIGEAMKQYRIFAQKIYDEEQNDYTIDHSSFIYFMGPNDSLMGLYRIQDTADYIAKDIQTLLNQ